MSDLPAGWEWTTLESLTDADRPICYGILMPKEHVPDGVPYVKVKDFSRGSLDVAKLRRTSRDIAAKYQRSSLVGGDVLVSIRGTYGRVIIAPSALDGANITQDTARVAVIGADNRYVALYLQSPVADGYFRRVARGVAVKGVNISDLKVIPVPFPPRLEQERIVAAIEEHISRLEAAEAAIGSAQLRARALYQALLSRAQAEGEEVALDDLLVDIEAGRSFKTPGRRAHADEWGVIKVSAMTWGEFDENENKAIPARIADPRYEIHAGDLLLSRANTSEYVGATVLVRACRGRLLLSDKSMRLLTRDGVERRWLRFALGSTQVRSQMSVLATGTSDSMRNISQAKVRGLRIRLPSADRQKILADEIEEALRARGLLEDELSTSRRRATGLRRSILAAAFLGKLVPQNPDDELASVLLERVRDERAAISPTARSRRKAESQGTPSRSPSILGG